MVFSHTRDVPEYFWAFLTGDRIALDRGRWVALQLKWETQVLFAFARKITKMPLVSDTMLTSSPLKPCCKTWSKRYSSYGFCIFNIQYCSYFWGWHEIKLVSAFLFLLQNASAVSRHDSESPSPPAVGSLWPWHTPTPVHHRATSVEVWTAMTPEETFTDPSLFSACSLLLYWPCWYWPHLCGTCWCWSLSCGWGHSTECLTTWWLPWPSQMWWWRRWSCHSAWSMSWTVGCGNWAVCCVRCGFPLMCSAAQPASGTWQPSLWTDTGPSPDTLSTHSRPAKRYPMWWLHSLGFCPPSSPCPLCSAGERHTQREWSARWARSHPTPSSPPLEHFTFHFVWFCLFIGRSTRLPSFELVPARQTLSHLWLRWLFIFFFMIISLELLLILINHSVSFTLVPVTRQKYLILELVYTPYLQIWIAVSLFITVTDELFMSNQEKLASIWCFGIQKNNWNQPACQCQHVNMRRLTVEGGKYHLRHH